MNQLTSESLRISYRIGVSIHSFITDEDIAGHRGFCFPVPNRGSLGGTPRLPVPSIPKEHEGRNLPQAKLVNARIAVAVVVVQVNCNRYGNSLNMINFGSHDFQMMGARPTKKQVTSGRNIGISLQEAYVLRKTGGLRLQKTRSPQTIDVDKLKAPPITENAF